MAFSLGGIKPQEESQKGEWRYVREGKIGPSAHGYEGPQV